MSISQQVKSKSSIESLKKRIPRRRIRRLRRLLRPESKSAKNTFRKLKIIGISLVLTCLVGILLSSERFRGELKRLAMNQFQMYLHGRENYCDETFEHWHISNTLHHRIIGQENALQEIDLALQQHDSVTALILVGTQGVGKTLTLNMIQEKFQWHLNTQQYIWSLIESPEIQLKHLLKLMNGLTTCGQNGIFIDSIPMQNIHIIDQFNQQLIGYCEQNNIKLITFYVFQIRNAIEANELIQLDKTKTIRFRQFNSDDIRNCINMESDRLKMAIKPKHIDEILEDIDAKRHGCKLIAAKIARYAIEDL